MILSEPIELKVGDRVKYDKIKGVVLSLSKNDAIIDSNGINLRVPISLLKLTNQSPLNNQKSVNISLSRPNSASVMIDLHGLRSDEAIEKLDKFISDALIAGFDEVLIKHGIGTGKLAYAIK